VTLPKWANGDIGERLNNIEPINLRILNFQQLARGQDHYQFKS
jgi:hypothetical protein